ncbi:TetR family transcriptional regulator C-terminal domain-containing protein [Polaribacter porphyrae]|uniref:Heat-shock protein n=1 Tax=Polaribacter porphyrae TaxID=1137780 RepID=A0A2S7WTN1_9FLAO|nr:TetR family transcriptional regulator C-terminal domain-containing protein [Polaribacter porphyrae]PQJ80957.1 heat-shock protein [Polaribacter porphyrae]
MAKKKKVSKLDILTLYMDLVSENQQKPNDVEDFCNQVNLDEDSFYSHFKSLKKVEKTIFNELFKNSLEVLVESEEFLSFDGKNKLLSLYFTFFENLNLNRTYIEVVLKGCKSQLKSYKTLSSLKKSFIQFVDGLQLTESILPIDGLEKIQSNVINQSSWVQLLITIKFWLEDTSESFEKTDIFIEKSINTSFELIENKFLKNVFDLGKFVYKEKFQKNTD